MPLELWSIGTRQQLQTDWVCLGESDEANFVFKTLQIEPNAPNVLIKFGITNFLTDTETTQQRVTPKPEGVIVSCPVLFKCRKKVWVKSFFLTTTLIECFEIRGAVSAIPTDTTGSGSGDSGSGSGGDLTGLQETSTIATSQISNPVFVYPENKQLKQLTLIVTPGQTIADGRFEIFVGNSQDNETYTYNAVIGQQIFFIRPITKTAGESSEVRFTALGDSDFYINLVADYRII